ncbi:hypothetical protein CYJ73_18635 [Gordonia terrae]|uniref:Transposase IS110-like N-terminal domain-containing protein n=1 Tax=Gordonia terrae TaxID=2055 RepID=A0A2I1R4V9_9ACTN|nr:hypothetical protein CYJ73_18635 [Gordonia terrae]
MQTRPPVVVAGCGPASGSSTTDDRGECRDEVPGTPRRSSVNPCQEGTFAAMEHSIASLDEVGSFCGIDWGGRHHHLWIIDARGTKILSRKVAHTVEGLATLVAVIATLAAPVRIAIERAEGLLVEHLQHHCDAELYCVSPKISARARERYRLASAKSDEFDAYVLADTPAAPVPAVAAVGHTVCRASRTDRRQPRPAADPRHARRHREQAARHHGGLPPRPAASVLLPRPRHLPGVHSALPHASQSSTRRRDAHGGVHRLPWLLRAGTLPRTRGSALPTSTLRQRRNRSRKIAGSKRFCRATSITEQTPAHPRSATA